MRHVQAECVLEAVRRLSRDSPALMADFLLMKRDGLSTDSPIPVTATSTATAIGRLMDMSRDDDDAAPNQILFNPFAPGWRTSDYGRTGPLSNIDGGVLGRVVEARRTNPRQVMLLSDYVSRMEPSLLSRKRSRIGRLRIEDVAAWDARFDDLPDDITTAELVRRFVDGYRITPIERASFFEDGGELAFSPGPADRNELIELVREEFPSTTDRRLAPVLSSEEVEAEALSARSEASAALPDDLLQAVRGPLVIPDVTIRQIVTLLRLGRNVILTGAPGTGKTTLAQKLAQLSGMPGGQHELPRSAGHLSTTATSDWTTFETIGGLAPDGSGRLVFREGMFLSAIRGDRWLIIDEVNRADVDKAFGQLFTVLSGQSVELPFQDGGDRTLSIRWDEADGASRLDGAEYVIGRSWRIIGTMNSFDRSHLFQLSSAFVRRFAFVNVPVPTLSELDGWLSARNMDAWVEDRIRTLIGVLEQVRPLGPAILQDVIEYVSYRIEAMPGAEERLSVDVPDPGADDGSDPVSVSAEDDPFLEAVVAYVLPQMDGLETRLLDALREGLDGVVAAASRSELERQFRELFLV